MACYRGIYRLIAVRTHTWAAVHDDMFKENNERGPILAPKECQDVEDAFYQDPYSLLYLTQRRICLAVVTHQLWCK